MRLNSKVAIITGAASGIGRATAELFAAEGAGVVLADIDRQQGRHLEKEISRKGGRALFIKTDVGADEEVGRMVKLAMAHYERLDILINSAGRAIGGNAVQVSEEDWERCMSVNLKGAWLCAKKVIPYMESLGGSIVNIASTHPLRAQSNYFPYAVAKGGVLAMTASMAVDFGPKRIRVNTVCPGFIDTPMNRIALSRMKDAPEKENAFLTLHPLRAVGHAEDIAQACLFLAGNESHFITGTTLVVDGGRTMYGRYSDET